MLARKYKGVTMRVLAFVLLALPVVAQQTAETLNTGSFEILTELRTKLDATKSKVGDPVRLKLRQPLVAKGKVVIPEGTTIVGHITEVKMRGENSSESRLGLRLDRAEWKHNSVPFEAVIVGHSQQVWKIVRGWDPMVEERMAAQELERTVASVQKPQSPASTSTTAPSSQPAKSSSPSTPPSSPTNPSSSAGKTPAESSPPPPQPSQSPTLMNTGELAGKYPRHEVVFTRGPRAVDVIVQPSADPNVGSVLTSSSREVVVPKGVLLVLKQSRKPIK